MMRKVVPDAADRIRDAARHRANSIDTRRRIASSNSQRQTVSRCRERPGGDFNPAGDMGRRSPGFGNVQIGRNVSMRTRPGGIGNARISEGEVTQM